MKIGFIGVGGVAQPHLENVSQMRGVQIGAVCDVMEERAQQVAAKYGATAYTSYREMLKRETLDACYVCVIPGAHGSIELDLAKARIPFYAEKPIHLDLNACQKVIDEIEKNDLVNGVGYHWRYTAASIAAKKFVDKHQPSLIEGWWYGGFVGAPWWRQMKLSGGQLVEQSTHIVDMARYLAGEVHTVYAVGASGAMTNIENYDIHDASVVALHFDSGAIGQITSGCIAETHGGPKVEISVKGRDWQAWTNGGLAILDDKKGRKEIQTEQSWQEQLGNGDKTFIQAVKTGNASKILSDYRSGTQTLAITLAANQSMKNGKPVKVRRFV
jgi:predicted dehydrogenase